MKPLPISSGARYPLDSRLRYGAAVTLGALGGLLCATLPADWAFKVAVTALLTVLVLVSAVLGGIGPGVLCTLLCTIAVAYWLDPAGSFHVGDPVEVLGVALFFASCLMVSGIAERMHRAMRVERAARGVAEQMARAEQEAHEATQRALAATQALERTREEMLALVAHDLRDPLGVIDLSAGLIEKAAGTDDEIRRRTAILHRTVRRMSGLVHNVLESSTLETGKLSLALAAVRAESLLAEAVEEHEPEARAKSLQLDYEVDRDVPPVLCDHDRIIQVLSNLVANALRFTPPGGRIHLTAAAMDGHVRFRVRDTGTGISPELLARLFERYSPARRALGGRTGLGLSIAKALVEQHGGTIQVESTVGAGTTFSFTLPIVAAPIDARPADASTRPPEPGVNARAQ